MVNILKTTECKMAQPFCKTIGVLNTLTYTPILLLHDSTTLLLETEMKNKLNIGPPKDFHKNIYNSLIHNCSKWEINQMSMSRQK